MVAKIALISDIQGNYIALQKVLSQIESHTVDQTICLGDVACGSHPHDVVRTLREKNIQVVKGNMDDGILNPRRHETDDLETQYFDDIDFWASQQLSDLDKVYMRSFRHTLSLTLAAGKTLLCFHGSPYSYNSVVDETLTESQLTQIFDGYTADIMATGHMHHPFLRRYQNSWILNPGSVGLPRKQEGKHPLYAEYAIVEIIDGQTHFEFRQIPIDEAEFVKATRDSGMPHAEWFLSQWHVTL